MPEWDAPGWHWTRDELITLIDERIQYWLPSIDQENNQ